MKKGGGSESKIIISPSKSVLVYALHSLEHVLGLARFRVFVSKLLLYYMEKQFPNSLKVRILKSNVVLVLLYGSSTWKVAKSIITKLQIFVNRCLKSIHIYWPNTISNMNLLKMADMQQIDVITKRHKCGWIGHTLRKYESSVARQLCNRIL